MLICLSHVSIRYNFISMICSCILAFTIAHFDCLVSTACVKTNCCTMLVVVIFFSNGAKYINFNNCFCFSADCTPLTLKEIQNELQELTAAKWHHLGVQLEIPSTMLSTIECNYPCDAQQCMTEVLRLRLRNAPECSWEKLTEALEAMGGYRVLVEKLRKKISQG